MTGHAPDPGSALALTELYVTALAPTIRATGAASLEMLVASGHRGPDEVASESRLVGAMIPDLVHLLAMDGLPVVAGYAAASTIDPDRPIATAGHEVRGVWSLRLALGEDER